LLNGLFQLIISTSLAIERGQVEQPMWRIGRYFHRLFVRPLRFVIAFFMLGDAGSDPVCGRRIEPLHGIRLRRGLLDSTAQESRRLDVVLAEVGTSIDAVRVKLDCTLKRGMRFFGQSDGAEPARMLRLLSIRAPQPELISAVLRINRSSALAL